MAQPVPINSTNPADDRGRADPTSDPVLVFLVARDLDRQLREMSGFPLDAGPSPEVRMSRVQAATGSILATRAGGDKYSSEAKLTAELMGEFERLVEADTPVWDGATRDLWALLAPHLSAGDGECLGRASSLAMGLMPGPAWEPDTSRRPRDAERAYALARAGAHAGDANSTYMYARMVHAHITFTCRIAALDSGEAPPTSQETADRPTFAIGPKAREALADAVDRLHALAAQLDDGKVWNQLGLMYAYDLNDVGKLKLAREYYTKAAALGSGEAHFELYLYDLNGLTGPPDPDAALMHIADAADLGHHRSIANLAGFYFTGMLGVPVDREKGLRAYHLAVQKGSARAARILAQLYENGEDGFPVDHKQAQAFLRIAEQLGG